MDATRLGAWRLTSLDGCRGARWRCAPRSASTTPRWSGCSGWRAASSDLVQLLVVDGLELRHLQLPDHRGQLEEGDLAHLLAEQRAADGRRHGDLPFLELQRVAEDQV